MFHRFDKRKSGGARTLFIPARAKDLNPNIIQRVTTLANKRMGPFSRFSPWKLVWREFALTMLSTAIRISLPKFGPNHRRIIAPSRTPGRGINCLAFLPPPNSSNSLYGPHALPVFVNLHGGGFVAGGPADNRKWCERVAAE